MTMFFLQRLILFCAYLLMGLLLQTQSAFSEGDDSQAAFFSIEVKDMEISMVANGILLEDLIRQIKIKTSVEIKGVVSRPDKPITFSHTGKSYEIVLRQLLRHLGEKNFAYEFADDKLIRITVFPEGTQTAFIPSDLTHKLKNDTTSMVEIVDILEETQAKKLGLKRGDYIYKYDGRRVFTHEELVAETFKDKGPTTVSMIIIRKSKLIRVILDRGFIGVHVRTKSIPKKELPTNIRFW